MKAIIAQYYKMLEKAEYRRKYLQEIWKGKIAWYVGLSISLLLAGMLLAVYITASAERRCMYGAEKENVYLCKFSPLF